jgi:hypothetical protein
MTSSEPSRAHGLRIMSGRDLYEHHRVASNSPTCWPKAISPPRSKPFSGRRSIWTCGSRWSGSGSATRSSSTGLASDSSGRHGLGGERLGSSPRPTSWALNRSMLSIAVIA